MGESEKSYPLCSPIIGGWGAIAAAVCTMETTNWVLLTMSEMWTYSSCRWMFCIPQPSTVVGNAVRVEDVGVRPAAGDAQQRLQADPLGRRHADRQHGVVHAQFIGLVSVFVLDLER